MKTESSALILQACPIEEERSCKTGAGAAVGLGVGATLNDVVHCAVNILSGAG